MNTTEVARGAAISVRQAIAMNTPKAVELWLDVVDDPADLRRLGEVLDAETAAKLFHSIDVPLGAKVLKALPNSWAGEQLATINSHRAAPILRHVDRGARDALLTAMPLERANVLRGAWSAFVASILPPVLKKLRIDPVVVSGPMIATIVDGTGLMIYFLIADRTLPQLAGL